MTHTSGPVPLASQDYVQRDFEAEVQRYLLHREWVLLLGPRQHGKTSALIRTQRTLTDAGFRCAFIDLQGLPAQYNFVDLLAWFSRGVARQIGGDTNATPEGKGELLEEWLECVIPNGSPVVILIDEASSIRDDWTRNAFFGQIRALKSVGAVKDKSVAAAVVFLFAGTFRPETLVDERNSPFNVCRRIDTEDLDAAKIATLARRVLESDHVQDLVDCIYAGVGGQPQLVQSLLAVAASAETDRQEADVVAELDRWRDNSNDHIDSLFRVVAGDPKLVQITSTAVAQGRVPNDAANVDYKFITVLGLMRRDGQFLVFRNDLYARIANASPQLRPAQMPQGGPRPHFYQLDLAAFGFIADAQYREICQAAYNGAVNAFNGGNYRLTLAGFGCALEALLLDVLVTTPAAVLASAIAVAPNPARPNFNQHERSANPESWRLVNLMKVARLLNRARGPLELPDCLREMRNLLHPHLMKQAYLPEAALAPEAVAAGGFFAMVMRDVQAP